MWFEYALVGTALLLSLLWLFRHFVKRASVGSCGGCAPRPPVSRLQKDIPILRNPR